MENEEQEWTIDRQTIVVSHLSKPYWPAEGITKGDLLRYDLAVAPVLLPHLAGRPVTLHVFPEGIHGPSYYRRDRPPSAPPWITGVDYRLATTGRVHQLLLIDSTAALIWLANSGAIELHAWSARVPDLEHPDQVIFDLDPGDEVGFAEVRQAALYLREALEQQGLRGYPKTSGGRGMHVYLPIVPHYTYAAVRAWVRRQAEELAAAHPELIAVSTGATHRGDRVTIDVAQNSIGRNTAAPYTVRALPGAPVSTPLTWKEVADESLDPRGLTLRTVPARLAYHGDLFAPALRADQELPGVRAAAVGG